MQIKHVLTAAAIGVSLVTVGFWVGSVRAGTAEPGSAADPLVSKGYVDSMVAFQVVTIPKDSTLVGESGTEVVLRSGQVVVVASTLGGLLDATEGADLPQGTAVKPNHMLVVPRSDGRGVTATMEAILMVKGTYAIRPAAAVTPSANGKP